LTLGTQANKPPGSSQHTTLKYLLDPAVSKKQDFAGYSLLLVMGVEVYFTLFITYHYVKAPKEEPDDESFFAAQDQHSSMQSVHGDYHGYSKRGSADAAGIHIVINKS
jgi:hypothetical protein